MQTNGQVSHAKVEAQLIGEPLTQGYKPTLPYESFFGPDGLPIFQMRMDIEWMLTLPMVRTALNYFKSGIAGAEFWGGQNPESPDDKKGLPVSENKEVSDFVIEQCQRFWDRGVPLLQEGYSHGWAGSENSYSIEDGPMKWDSLRNFAPRDTFLLTKANKPIGVRVKNIIGTGEVDLWMASSEVPSKGMWYAHEPRYGQHYGQSQLLGAWRPCRRACWKDGAESVLDGGVYRFAYAGPLVRYPEEDLQGPRGIPNTTLDSAGNPRRYSRDLARQIAEQAKAGAGIGLPSSQYSKETGGGPKWDIVWPSSVLNVDPIINYLKQLYDQISYGIGVPPELLQAAETGSGFSGRRIPLEAFLDGQQRIGDRFLHLFVEQVLRPLVRWNWGNVKWNVMLKRFVETKAKASQGDQQQNGQNIGKPKEPNAQLSLLITDRVREIARHALRRAA